MEDNVKGDPPEGGSLSRDLLLGAEPICNHIYGEVDEEKLRRTYYLLGRGVIPAGKLGAQWIGSKSAINDHLRRVTRGQTVERVAPQPKRIERRSRGGRQMRPAADSASV
jgi:hypothetical protein